MSERVSEEIRNETKLLFGKGNAGDEAEHEKRITKDYIEYRHLGPY